MSSKKPHRIEDNEPAGHAVVGETIVKRSLKKKKVETIIVSIGFDDNLKEFELWEYLYDFDTEHFQMEAIPDYEKRIQYYQIKAAPRAMSRFKLWLIEKEIKYKVDKKT